MCCFGIYKMQDTQANQAGMSVAAALSALVAEGLDEWKDADMESLICYLRGNKSLHVPDDIRKALNMNK